MICLSCMGQGSGPAEDNGFVVCSEPVFPPAGPMESCPDCGGSGQEPEPGQGGGVMGWLLS